MKFEDFPADMKPYLLPKAEGRLLYRCLNCRTVHSIEKLLYTCPECGQVLLLQDPEFDRLKQIDGALWHRIFDYRRMLDLPSLAGIYRYHEFLGSVMPLDAVVYLGEGHTPIIEANPTLQHRVGLRFFFKNEGQNPSASFKDRGMASALSYINWMLKKGAVDEILAVCASTGDTSAAAALYAAYLTPGIKSAVLLPHNKVTPQQLSQPLGNGATVFEIPGVFDDCMKVVEALSEQYHVALLNSKNAWRILGQESYAYEISQFFSYCLQHMVVVVPVGNAGNITAVMNGFIKFYQAGVIDTLPKIIGVQSAHANPVCRYYSEPLAEKREFIPVDVKPSVAQAAMIGNPVSMPRVIELVQHYHLLFGRQRVFFVEVDEQSIMDWQLTANRNGHIACTHGGESLAGLVAAYRRNLVTSAETAVLDSTAHALKFSGFQDLYFQNSFPDEFSITPDAQLINTPIYICPEDAAAVPTPERPLREQALRRFVDQVAADIGHRLQLKKKIG